MISYLEFPDPHFSLSYWPLIKIIFEKVAEAARKYQVDFIAIPGDLFDAPIMNTDKGGINHLRKLVRMLLDICPVCAVEGTPSHDGPGCYGPLEEMGLVLLRPGKVYGLFKRSETVILNKDHCGKFIMEIPQKDETTPIESTFNSNAQAIIFGIPELNKQNIQSRLNLSADQANYAAVEAFNQYVSSFLAPHRTKYADIPSICLFHGNVSDAHKSNENDPILRASDIVLHTETMAIANIDRWTLGHIHLPWESREICAGYAGSWGKDWKELGFKPGMNLVEINENVPDVSNDMTLFNGKNNIRTTRIPYGTPERRKIKYTLEKYDSDIAYLLETDDENAAFPTARSVHELSEIRYKPKPKESRRITAEQMESAATLKDIFNLYDPEAPQSVKDKIDEITETVPQREKRPINAELEYVEVHGCTEFFGDKTFVFDITQVYSITELFGTENGIGKSGGLSFCSWYPLTIGKMPKCGKISAIHEYFDKEDSRIIKRGKINGVPHEHLITIRGAHTQNPKVECYLTIDGQPQLDKGTFNEMMAECERLYGSFDDYLLTTFYVQPQQGNYPSGLMSANMTTIRNLVHSIVGIDREREKEFCLSKVKTLDNEISDLQSWLKGAADFQADVSELEKNKSDKTDKLNQIIKFVDEKLQQGKEEKKQLDILTESKHKNDAEKMRRENDLKRLSEIERGIRATNEKITSLTAAAESLSDNEKLIADDDENIKLFNEQEKLYSEYKNKRDRLSADIREKENEYKQFIKGCEAEIHEAKSQIKNDKNKIELLNTPCEHCGNIPFQDSADKIDAANAQINICELLIRDKQGEIEDYDLSEIEDLKKQLSDLIEPDKKTIFRLTNREEILQNIKTGQEATAKISAAKDMIIGWQKEQNELNTHIYEIDDTIDKQINDQTEKVETLRNEYTQLDKEKAGYEFELKSIDEQIQKAEKNNNKIKETADKIAIKNNLLSDWQYLAKSFQANKLPAFELELILDEIDREASKIIEPYYDGKYSFTTETQQQGKKAVIDRFDIMVHDSVNGRSKSFIDFNPGTKAFLNDAYVKALIKQRNKRFHRTYSPVILDEADGPIQPGYLDIYYDIQRRYWGENKVIVVSHNPAAHEHIENTVYMEELKS